MNNASRPGHGNAADQAGPTVAATKVGGTKKVAARVPATKAARKGSKPFSMSYGGGSTAEYVQYRIDRGAR